MLVGTHVSVEGGLFRGIERAEEHGMTAIQVFTRNARSWRSPPLTDADVERFASARASSGVRVVVAHASYLPNPASPDRALRRRSERAIVDELRRCDRLGIPWLVLHPGSHRGTDARGGIARAAGVLSRALAATDGCRAGILIENQAGQGDTLGARFEEVGDLLSLAGDGPRLGACLDTCHAFAAGHDLGDADGYRSMRADLDRTVGLERVRVVHVNDCVSHCGSHVDRHAGIGLGEMGYSAFERVVGDPVLGCLPLILETPKHGEDGEDLDGRNIAVLRSFSQGGPEGLN